MQGAKRALFQRPLLTGGTALGLMALILLLGAALLSSQSLRAAQPSEGPNAQPAAPARPDSTSLVLSQVYGGGGNGGSLYTNDFIELFNPQNVPVSVTNWSVQYASATGSTWQVSVLTGTVTLQPGQYYLIQEAQGAGGTQPLPTPDNIGSIPMSGTAGKVALVNNSTMLTGTCPTAGVVDFVGFGGTANCFEGTGPATAPSNTTSDVRLLAGCTDSDNNAADFATANPPTPRNTSSTFNPCGVVLTPTNTATPTVTITPGGPTNTPTLTRTPLPPGPRIHDIQGAAHISPYNATPVANVQGMVTALRTNGFYMQDPVADANDSTSEAIFVFTSSAPTVSVGALVSVSGQISEFRAGGAGGLTNLTQTEIGSPVIVLVSSGNPLPTPVVIGAGGRTPPTVVIEDDATGDVETSGVFDPATDGIDFYESMESMRVQVNNPVATGPTNSFGEISVLADDGAGAGVRTTRGGIIIQATDFNPERIILAGDISFNTPSVNVGDHFSGPAVGIMDYTFGNFKLQITQALSGVSNNLPQEVATPAGANQIAIGNFNVENLAPTDPPAKFATLAGLIVNNVKSPDIISVEEIQDNSGAVDNGVVAADVTWNTLIAAITTAGGPTYEYRQINPVNDQDGGQPGGNIRQGFLFRSDRGISFVDRAGGCSTCATTVQPGPQGPILSSSPGRIDPANTAWSSSRKPLAGEFLINGQRLFVIGNHFNSKGGDDPLFGHFQPPTRSSETQRHNQAVVVNNFVNQILALDTNANIVVLGDLNDFNFSDALTTLRAGNVLQDLILTLPLPERYTYDYDGNSQDLDHILVSNHISDTVPLAFDVIHVNSEFANQASDHEPQAVRLAFPVQGTPTVTPTPNTTVTATGTPITTATPTRTATAGVTGTASPSRTSTPTVGLTQTATPGGNTATPGTPSPTRTATVLVTVTVPVQPTQTATAIPTTCPVQFVDAPPGSTFYDYIRCLACRGIVGGYPCGGPGEPCPGTYFRPNNQVTRGQVSKIVSESAGFADAIPSTQWTFQDVPPSGTFWLWVERLSGRGIIGGYPCGGAFEPCVAPDNRPYFRPNNDVTRGQLSKIVAGAAGWTETPTGQTFEDVVPGSTFYLYVERVASRGIVSGYPCGGAGEPCVAPGNRPYFRPFANATRGQMSKIAASAFFPGCATPAR